MTVVDFPSANGNAPVTDSWTPIKLSTLPAHPPVKPTLGDIGIVYPGKRHVFSGPPESAKTLVAYIVILEVLRHAGTVVLIDFEMGGYDARARLVELGASSSEIDHVHYLEPDEPANDDRIQLLIGLEPALVVIDAAAGAYQLEGLDDNKRGDVEKWSRLYVQRFWRHGIATIVIDHVPKDTENRGRYAIGSERKLGSADVHLGFDTITPISRGTEGKYKITTHKDRGGVLKRGRLADVHLESDPDTHQIGWDITAATAGGDDDQGHYFRPTGLMEKVSIYLEHQPEAVGRNAIADAIGGTKKYVLAAVNALVREGYVADLETAGRSKPVASARPYRENDPSCNQENRPVEGMVPIVLSSSRTIHSSMVRHGSAMVREPLLVDGSDGSPPYGGDTAEPHHPDPQNPDHGSAWLDYYLEWADQIAPEDEP